MGTSTRYSLPTTGNWPAVKREVTIIGQTGTANTSDIAELLGDYVQAQGGAAAAAQQASKASHAGAKLGGVFAGVRDDGLTQTLEDIGLSDFVGKPASEVMRGLVGYLVGAGSLLDEDLVREAFQDYREEVIGQCDTYEELDATLSELVRVDGIGDNIKVFFGHFILRRFLRDFKERLMQKVSSIRTCNQILRDIKVYIFDRLSSLMYARDYSEFEWRGTEGRDLVESILASTWRVFGEVQWKS